MTFVSALESLISGSVSRLISAFCFTIISASDDVIIVFALDALLSGCFLELSACTFGEQVTERFRPTSAIPVSELRKKCIFKKSIRQNQGED